MNYVSSFCSCEAPIRVLSIESYITERAFRVIFSRSTTFLVSDSSPAMSWLREISRATNPAWAIIGLPLHWEASFNVPQRCLSSLKRACYGQRLNHSVSQVFTPKRWYECLREDCEAERCSVNVWPKCISTLFRCLRILRHDLSIQYDVIPDKNVSKNHIVELCSKGNLPNQIPIQGNAACARHNIDIHV